MTYAGLFEKCKTLAETRELRRRLLSEVTSNFRRMQELEIDQAYRKRRKELRNEMSVAN